MLEASGGFAIGTKSAAWRPRMDMLEISAANLQGFVDGKPQNVVNPQV